MGTWLYNDRSILNAPEKTSPIKENNPRNTTPGEVHPKSAPLVNHPREVNPAALSDGDPQETDDDSDEPLPENVKNIALLHEPLSPGSDTDDDMPIAQVMNLERGGETGPGGVSDKLPKSRNPPTKEETEPGKVTSQQEEMFDGGLLRDPSFDVHCCHSRA